MDTNFKATKSLWLDVYGNDYRVAGGMYRGEPPTQFFSSDWINVHTCNEQDHRENATIDTYTSSDDKLLYVLPGVSLTHLIGKVGASSVGRDEDSQLVWMSMDDPDAFVKPEPKSTTKGVNANPRKDSYVFGNGGMF